MIVVREEADRTDGKFAGGWILSLMQGTALGDSVKYVESWKASGSGTNFILILRCFRVSHPNELDGHRDNDSLTIGLEGTALECLVELWQPSACRWPCQRPCAR